MMEGDSSCIGEAVVQFQFSFVSTLAEKFAEFDFEFKSFSWNKKAFTSYRIKLKNRKTIRYNSIIKFSEKNVL